MDKTDEELIVEYIHGDEQAFEQLVGRHLSGMYSFVFRLVGNGQEAEDIVQETFLKAWKNIKNYRAESSKFKTWVLHIARNTSIDYMRKKKHLVFSDFSTNDKESDGSTMLEETVPDPTPLPDEVFAKLQDVQELQSILATLPPKQREVLTLHYTNHLTFEEIGKLIDEPQNTVKSRHHRALLTLRKQARPVDNPKQST